MNDPQASPDTAPNPTPEEINSVLFAQMVMQQSSMAMMLLGKSAHPQTGETVRDLDGARLFIDLLEMLEHKTKGNLSQEESALLQQTLMSLRMAFVEAVDAAPAPSTARPTEGAAPPQPASASPPPPAQPAPAPDVAEAESRKKFTKKY